MEWQLLSLSHSHSDLIVKKKKKVNRASARDIIMMKIHAMIRWSGMIGSLSVKSPQWEPSEWETERNMSVWFCV